MVLPLMTTEAAQTLANRLKFLTEKLRLQEKAVMSVYINRENVARTKGEIDGIRWAMEHLYVNAVTNENEGNKH